MLQQTQVPRVLQKYDEFLKIFPTLAALHRAPFRSVLRAWQGLGYNRRALALKKTAAILMNEYGARVPRSEEKLRALPGVGPATASAILAFAHNMPVVFIETNIRRVFIYFFFPKRKNVQDDEIRELVTKTLDRKNSREWYWALMDYGSMLGGLPDNPNKRSARYRKQGKFRGSRRELRGKILAAFLREPRLYEKNLISLANGKIALLRNVLRELEREGFLARKGGAFSILLELPNGERSSIHSKK